MADTPTEAEGVTETPTSTQTTEVTEPTPQKKVQAPDEAAFKAKNEEYRQQIEAAKQELASMRASIEKGSQGNQKTVTELAAARQAWQEAKAATRTKINARAQLHQQSDALRSGREASWQALQRVKESLRFQSLESIDSAINDLEFQLRSTTISLKEEKKLVAEISTLNSQKGAVRDYTIQLDAHKKERDGNDDLREQIKALNAEVAALRDVERQKGSIVESIQKKMDGSRSGVTSLYKQRDATHRKLRELITAQKKYRDEHYKAKEEWYMSQQEHRKKIQEEKKKQHDEYLKRKADERAEQEKELAEIHPYELEMQICDNITAYLKSLLPNQPASSAATSAPATTATGIPALPEPRKPGDGPPVPAGTFRTKGRDDDDEEGFFGGQSKKKGRRRRKGQHAETPNEPSNASIKHPLDVFSDFSSINVDPPLFVKDISAALEAVKARKDYYSAAPPKPKREVRESKEKGKAEVKPTPAPPVDSGAVPPVVDPSSPTWVKKKEEK